MVTFTNAATGGFTLNAGQSNVTSNECMTKTQALTKYNLSASAMSSYASNQLVPKSGWVSASTTYYAFCTSSATTTGGSVSCSITLDTYTFYTTNSSGVVNVGDIVYYLDGGVYSPFNFETSYLSYNEGSTRKVLQIDQEGSGAILSKTTCGATSFDLYNADLYDCSTLSSIGTTIVAFPSGTSVNFARYYTSSTTAGEFAYKPTSTASSGSGIILDTTGYTTVTLACAITF